MESGITGLEPMRHDGIMSFPGHLNGFTPYVLTKKDFIPGFNFYVSKRKPFIYLLFTMLKLFTWVCNQKLL